MSIRHSITDYVEQLKALLPPGKLWTTLAEDAVFLALLESIAAEFARVNDRAAVLCEELDPRTANELFDEWETFAGLPDPCIGELPTLSQRRAAVVARLTATGGQSRQYFIDLAASLGFTATISEYDGVNPALIDQFYWQMDLPLNGDIVEFDVGSTVNEPLRNWGTNELLECVIQRLKPAHTTVIFSYT